MRILAWLMAAALLAAGGQAAAEEVQIEVFWPEGVAETDSVSIRFTDPSLEPKLEEFKRRVDAGLNAFPEEITTATIQFPNRRGNVTVPDGQEFRAGATIVSLDLETTPYGTLTAKAHRIVTVDDEGTRRVLVAVSRGWHLGVRIHPPEAAVEKLGYHAGCGDSNVLLFRSRKSGLLSSHAVHGGEWRLRPMLGIEHYDGLPSFKIEIPEYEPGGDGKMEILVDVSGDEPRITADWDPKPTAQRLYPVKLRLVHPSGHNFRSSSVEIFDAGGRSVWNGSLENLNPTHFSTYPMFPSGNYTAVFTSQGWRPHDEISIKFSIPCDQPVEVDVDEWWLHIPRATLGTTKQVEWLREDGTFKALGPGSMYEDGTLLRLPGPGEFTLILYPNARSGASSPRLVTVNVTERFTVLKP